MSTRKIVFLLVFVFLSVLYPVFNVGGNTKAKLFFEKNFKKKVSQKKSLEIPSGWCTASASYYDPKDPRQTKKKADGKGAFKRKIKSGSVAFGSVHTQYFKEKGLTVFIQIEGLNIKTPYGKNIFRIDDAMNKRYRQEDKYFIDFFYKDLDRKHKKMGRFQIKFKIYKIIKTADLHLRTAFFV
jgi:hypothetical protein